MAGFDTSGHTATWVLFLVSQHPQVSARLSPQCLAPYTVSDTQKPPAGSCLHVLCSNMSLRVSETCHAWIL